MMKRCLILTGGILDLKFAGLYLKTESFDKLIAVDGGVEYAKVLGLTPDYIVGDFDTLNPEIAAEYHRFPHIVWEVHKPEKNETDTELAVSRAAAIGCDEVVLLGATGGRLDHTLGNLQLLYACLQRGIRGYLIDPQNKIYLLDQKHTFKSRELWGQYISFLPLSEVVEGITLTGFRYPLDDKTIRKGEEVGLCISNELKAESGVIVFHNGVLICVESHD